jgi:hypothetical protein
VCDEVQTFKGDENTKRNSENIKKARAMTVAPPLYVGDNTHGSNIFVYTNITKYPWQRQATKAQQKIDKKNNLQSIGGCSLVSSNINY